MTADHIVEEVLGVHSLGEKQDHSDADVSVPELQRQVDELREGIRRDLGDESSDYEYEVGAQTQVEIEYSSPDVATAGSEEEASVTSPQVDEVASGIESEHDDYPLDVATAEPEEDAFAESPLIQEAEDPKREEVRDDVTYSFENDAEAKSTVGQDPDLEDVDDLGSPSLDVEDVLNAEIPVQIQFHSELYLYDAANPSSGILSEAPGPGFNIEALFASLRDFYPDITNDSELFIVMPQLGLEIGEDNIYCNDTTLLDLLRLLDTCDTAPESLVVRVECRERFISKLNTLFANLNDLPKVKRRRYS